MDNTSANSTYTIRPALNGREQAVSESAVVWAQQYLSIPIQAPAGGTMPDGVDTPTTPMTAAPATWMATAV